MLTIHIGGNERTRHIVIAARLEGLMSCIWLSDRHILEVRTYLQIYKSEWLFEVKPNYVVKWDLRPVS